MGVLRILRASTVLPRVDVLTHAILINHRVVPGPVFLRDHGDSLLPVFNQPVIFPYAPNRTNPKGIPKQQGNE